MSTKVVLITGAAKRIGAAMARYLHEQGMNIIIHYRSSKSEAEQLMTELNARRKQSAVVLSADLNSLADIERLVLRAYQAWQRLDVLINNASSFFATPLARVLEVQWDDLVNSNLKAPLFLAKAAQKYLAEQQGCIINITDVHAERPMKYYSVYCAAKAGLVMLTKALAKELAPNIRVNAIAPGNILWPSDDEFTTEIKMELLQRTALKKLGMPEDIAKAAYYLITQADYVTGQVITVDGGKLLSG